jgi:hypothetical protein
MWQQFWGRLPLSYLILHKARALIVPYERTQDVLWKGYNRRAEVLGPKLGAEVRCGRPTATRHGRLSSLTPPSRSSGQCCASRGGCCSFAPSNGEIPSAEAARLLGQARAVHSYSFGLTPYNCICACPTSLRSPCASAPADTLCCLIRRPVSRRFRLWILPVLAYFLRAPKSMLTGSPKASFPLAFKFR